MYQEVRLSANKILDALSLRDIVQMQESSTISAIIVTIRRASVSNRQRSDDVRL